MSLLFFTALGLMLIFEGVLPFLGPRYWRRLMQQMIIQSDRSIRLFGLISMLLGLSVLYLTR